MKIGKFICFRKKKKEKGKITKTLILPEEVVQHIQSFMTGKEAARSAILSKSWHAAWLTRPTIDLNDDDFYSIGNRHSKRRDAFGEFAKKTMQRYEDSSLKIQSFSLRGFLTRGDDLIARALKLGATHLQLEICCSSLLPQEVLGSETLIELTLSGCDIYGDYVIRCSRLRSLSLERVTIMGERFKGVVLSCRNSLEELSLTNCHVLRHGLVNLNELRKLRRLQLQGLHLDSMLSTHSVSRFPCLEDLTIHSCRNTRCEIDVPSIRKFVYSGDGVIPSVNGASEGCELDITIDCTRFRLYDTPWFLDMKRRLAKFRQSRISLCVKISNSSRRLSSANEAIGTEVEAEPIAVENLKIHAHSSLWSGLVLRLLEICRPKLITPEYWHYDKLGDVPFPCMGLMQKLLPNPDMFGQFGLEKVNMEVYDWHAKEWQPLVLEKPLHATKILYNSRKVRFELIWD